MVWCNEDGLEIQINKSDLFEQPTEKERMTLRSAGRLTIDFGAPCFDYLYLNDFEARLSLKDAQDTVSSSTPFSELKIQTWIDVNSNVWIIECEADYKAMLPDGAKASISLSRWGSRTFRGWYSSYNKDASLGIGNARVSDRDGDILLEGTSKNYFLLRTAVKRDNCVVKQNLSSKVAMATSTEYFSFRLAISFFARSHVQN